MVDGHALNEAWDGTAYFERGAAIPFELIDRIEIILGPGSVLYGSNAMLGVVNIITRPARSLEGLNLAAESELGKSARVAAVSGHEWRFGGHAAELVVGLEYYRQSGPAFDFGPQPEEGGEPWGGRADRFYWTRIPAAYASLSLGRFSLRLRAASYRRGTPYINQFNQFAGNFNDPDNWERDQFLSLDAQHRLLLSSIAELSSRVYADLYDYLQNLDISDPGDCAPGQDQGCVQRARGLSRWAGLEEQLHLDWRRDGRFVTLLGIDARLRHAGSQLDLTDAGTGATGPSIGYVRKTEHLLGIYLQQTARPLRGLGLSLGARFDQDERFGSHLSPRGAAALALWNGAGLKTIYAEAFRAPTVYELHYADPASQVPAPGLRPEVARSVEVVFEQRFAGQRLMLGAFRSWWRDMVLLESLSDSDLAAAIAAGTLNPDVTSAVRYLNASSLSNLGAELAFEGFLRGGELRYGLNLTAARARRRLTDGSDFALTVAPQLYGNARLSYELPGSLPVLALAVSYTGRRLAD